MVKRARKAKGAYAAVAVSVAAVMVALLVAVLAVPSPTKEAQTSTDVDERIERVVSDVPAADEKAGSGNEGDGETGPQTTGGAGLPADEDAKDDVSDTSEPAVVEGADGNCYVANEVLVSCDAALTEKELAAQLAATGIEISSVEIVMTDGDMATAVVSYSGETDPEETGELLVEADAAKSAGPNYVLELADIDESQANAAEPEAAGIGEPIEGSTTASAADADDAEEAGLAATVDDPDVSKQWDLESIGATSAWDTTTCSGSATVAVLDSGVDADHPDLAANLLLDYAKNTNTGTVGATAVNDETANGHGTHVAGVIGAVANNGEGVAGVSYNALVLPVKVTYNAKGWMKLADVIEGIDYVVELKCAEGAPDELASIRVMNLSLGTASTQNESVMALLEAAIQKAEEADILVVAAAGNSSSSEPFYPAAYEGVVAVSALARDNEAEDGVAFADSYSNYGNYVDLCAPGSAVYSTDTGGSYDSISGTSLAAPEVSATAALVFAADPELTADEAAEILSQTALDLGEEGQDDYYGAGEVQADAAVKAAAETAGATTDPSSPEEPSNPTDVADGDQAELLSMYRLYNPNSGEHFYTASEDERDSVVEAGWSYEGIGWLAPAASSTPVYRLYNPNAGDHHYTTSTRERGCLIAAGWSYEGIGWYSDDEQGVQLYRLYNPNAVAGTHHYTASATERDWLVSLGWTYEGVGWYGSVL